MTVRLWPAGAENAPAMADILREWVQRTAWMPDLHSPEATVRFCETLAPLTVIAREDDTTLGFLSRREEEVLCFYIAQAARGRGVGSAMLAAAQSARPRLALWTFAANNGARRFYARHGFVETGGTAGDNDEGLPDIRMEWRRA